MKGAHQNGPRRERERERERENKFVQTNQHTLTGIGIFVNSFPIQFFIILQRLILALGRGEMVARL